MELARQSHIRTVKRFRYAKRKIYAFRYMALIGTKANQKGVKMWQSRQHTHSPIQSPKKVCSKFGTFYDCASICSWRRSQPQVQSKLESKAKATSKGLHTKHLIFIALHKIAKRTDSYTYVCVYATSNN